jgi:hypothetical protein
MNTLRAAVVLALLAASVSSASAGLSTGYKLVGVDSQWSTVVPIRPDVSGKPSCPGNFVMRGKVCLSILADRRALHFSAGNRETARPLTIHRGRIYCPSNFIAYRKVCTSLYY